MVTVALLTLELRLVGVRSLKEKRGIIRPLLNGLRRRQNLSVCEAGMHDVHGRTLLAAVWVGPDPDSGRQVLAKALAYAEGTPGVQLLNETIEII